MLGLDCFGLGGRSLIHVSKEDRDDSKHRVTVCMLVKGTIEYCDLMAAVTSDHMLFRSLAATGLSPRSECFGIDLLNTETACNHSSVCLTCLACFLSPPFL